MMSDMIELKQSLEEAKSVLTQFQNEHKEALKKSEVETSEFKAKSEKMAQDIIKGIEAQQKMQLEIDRLASLKSQTVESKEEYNGIDRKSDCFAEFLKSPGVEGYDEFLQKKTLNTAIQTDGGFMTNIQRFGDIITNIAESSDMRALATVVTTTEKEGEWILVDGAATSAVKTNENGARSATGTRSIAKIKIPTHIYYAEPKVTTVMLADVPQTEKFIMDWAAEDFAITENTDFFSGDGVGCPKGILSYTAATAGTYTRNAIQQKNMGHATALTSNGLIDLQTTLKRRFQPNATWVMKRATFAEILKLVDGVGRYMFNINLDKSTAAPFNLLTRPVVFAEDMPAVGANALSIAYGDFKKGFVIVDRAGMTLLRDPYKAKGFVSYYFEKRTGGEVVDFDAIILGKVAV